MKFPLRSTVQIGSYVASQQRKGERYPLVLMLEPTLACNIACIGCGKIREYESNRARLSVEECIDAGRQCPAPVVSICGARAKGFRVTTNTTVFKETEVEDVIEMMGYLTNEVGIDGMLIAPGYQYSQIDPALTMTREEHEVKFRAIRAAVREHGYRWIATPLYQDFLTGERKLSCAPWGSITRNPYGWKGPCYLL